MAEPSDRRADTTRGQILRAAAHQFARRPYHDVGLDDILAVAELTKGAMYFHFRSKHALALAVIDEQVARDRVMLAELLGRNLSGLETLIDAGYQLALEDLRSDSARAVLRLLPAVGWADGLESRVFADRVAALTPAAERAVAEGDVTDRCAPADVVRALLALYLGLRQAADLDEPAQFLARLQQSWAVLLGGIVAAGREGFFGQFIARRTALALRTVAAPAEPVGR